MPELFINPLLGIILPLAIINIITFAVTGFDKYSAIKKRRRVPEKNFIIFAVFCGGIGTLAAFYLFRHKTLHFKLLASVWILTVLEILVGIFFAVSLSGYLL